MSQGQINQNLETVGGVGQTSTNGRDMNFILSQRDAKAFKRASRHSWFVRFLRVAFPAIGLFVVFIVGGSYFWKQAGAPTVTIEETTLTDNRIVMKNPELKGFDKQERPYVLNASEAIQDVKNPSAIELHQIDANVPMQDGVYADIKAGNGFYDSKQKTLKLGGEVDVTTKTGMLIKLQDADIDMNAGTLITQSPVFMSSPQAKISANMLSIEGNGEIVKFNESVKMTIYPDKIERANTQLSQN